MGKAIQVNTDHDASELTEGHWHTTDSAPITKHNRLFPHTHGHQSPKEKLNKKLQLWVEEHKQTTLSVSWIDNYFCETDPREEGVGVIAYQYFC